MKTQTQFKNASLVSVVDGSIVVKDSTGREHTFTNASVVSVNNGTIIIESEWEPKRGELIKITGCNYDSYSLFEKEIEGSISTFGFISLLDSEIYRLGTGVWPQAGTITISPVTPEEQKEFDDFCKSQGKIWNKETLQWEKYRWKPIKDVKYFHIIIAGGTIQVVDYRWTGDRVDENLYDMGNCFKTREEAEIKLAKIKKLLLEV